MRVKASLSPKAKGKLAVPYPDRPTAARANMNTILGNGTMSLVAIVAGEFA